MTTDVDLTNLVATIIAVLAPAAPYLTKAAESAAARVGADAWQKARELYGKLHERFTKDKNEKATQTLALFVNEPATFEEALSRILLATLEKHPEWAADVRAVLAESALQEIVARNGAVLTRVTQSLSGSGTQRIEADKAKLEDIRQEKK
jgi:hypothetical protein